MTSLHRDLLCRYFIETSVHGLKYIVDESSQIWEKLFWSIVVSLGLTIAGKFAFDVAIVVAHFISLHSRCLVLWINYRLEARTYDC